MLLTSFAWLHDVGVAADGGHGEHPQGDHGGEVEGGDTGANADRDAVRDLGSAKLG